MVPLEHKKRLTEILGIPLGTEPNQSWRSKQRESYVLTILKHLI